MADNIQVLNPNDDDALSKTTTKVKSRLIQTTIIRSVRVINPLHPDTVFCNCLETRAKKRDGSLVLMAMIYERRSLNSLANKLTQGNKHRIYIFTSFLEIFSIYKTDEESTDKIGVKGFMERVDSSRDTLYSLRCNSYVNSSLTDRLKIRNLKLSSRSTRRRTSESYHSRGTISYPSLEEWIASTLAGARSIKGFDG